MDLVKLEVSSYYYLIIYRTLQYFTINTLEIDGLTFRSNMVNCLKVDTIHVLREELAALFCSKSMKVCYQADGVDAVAIAIASLIMAFWTFQMFGYTMSILFVEAVKMLVMNRYGVSGAEVCQIYLASM